MRYHTTNVFGVFVLEDGEILEYETFPDDPATIAEKIDGDCPEEQRLAEEHETSGQQQHDAFELASEVGLIENEDELYERQRAVAQQLTRDRIGASQQKDQVLVQAVRAMEDLETVTNSMIERLRAWYSLYFPELEEEMDDHPTFARFVAERFDRSAAEIETESTGMELSDRDEQALRDYAEQTRDSYDTRDSIEAYVTDTARKIAPNLSAVLGPRLAARIISEAGSLEKLAQMPSSTVQVLGAEKALFRHMRGEGSAPKHGVLFMHPKVHSVDEGKRGKMARFIANKATIAARIDHFDGDYRGDSLREEVREQYEEVQEE